MRLRAGLLTIPLALSPFLPLPASQPPQEIPPEVLHSPDRRTAVSLEAGPAGISWSATRDARPLIAPSSAGLVVNGRTLGRGGLRSVRRTEGNATIEGVFYPRRRFVRDRFNEVSLTFDA